MQSFRKTFRIGFIQGAKATWMIMAVLTIVGLYRLPWSEMGAPFMLVGLLGGLLFYIDRQERKRG